MLELAHILSGIETWPPSLPNEATIVPLGVLLPKSIAAGAKVG